jgi:hypothetical protein
MLRDLLVVAIKRLSPRVKIEHFDIDCMVGRTLTPEIAERIKNIELEVLAEERLVLVRAVHINEKIADFLQCLYGCR